MRALCERDVQVKGVIASTAPKEEPPTFGADGCYEGEDFLQITADIFS